MCLLCTIKPEYKRQEANAIKPLINNNNSNFNNNNNNNNLINASYGALDSKWSSLADQITKVPLISQASCKNEYSNMCFTYSAASNGVLAN